MTIIRYFEGNTPTKCTSCLKPLTNTERDLNYDKCHKHSPAGIMRRQRVLRAAALS